mmetsp:Transcript_83228/g.222468  ORF Transcript_83228/g.222468 Transcript_83228/m.222468 type:complete len:219 (-) Transcript_83228:1280-1936(-)
MYRSAASGRARWAGPCHSLQSTGCRRHQPLRRRHPLPALRHLLQHSVPRVAGGPRPSLRRWHPGAPGCSDGGPVPQPVRGRGHGGDGHGAGPVLQLRGGRVHVPAGRGAGGRGWGGYDLPCQRPEDPPGLRHPREEGLRGGAHGLRRQHAAAPGGHVALSLPAAVHGRGDDGMPVLEVRDQHAAVLFAGDGFRVGLRDGRSLGEERRKLQCGLDQRGP